MLNHHLFINFVHNFLLLLGLAYGLSLLFPIQDRKGYGKAQILIGILFSVLCLTSMLNSVNIGNGIELDLVMVFQLTCSAFCGFIAASLNFFAVTIFYYFYFGKLSLLFLLSLPSALVLGSLFYQKYYRVNERFQYSHLIVLSLASWLIYCLCYFLQAYLNGVPTQMEFGLYSFVFFIPSSLILFVSLNRELLFTNLNQQLDERTSHFQKLFDDSPIAQWLEDASELKRCVESDPNLEELQKSPQKILEIYSRIRVIRMNSACRQLLGIMDERDLVNLIPSIVVPESQHTFIDVIKQLARHPWFKTEGFVRNLKTGEKSFVKVESMVLPGYEDDWSQVLVSLIDLSDRRKLEDQLSESAFNYQLLFDNPPVGLLYLDASEIRSESEGKAELSLQYLKITDSNLESARIFENERELDSKLLLKRIPDLTAFFQSFQKSFEQTGKTSISSELKILLDDEVRYVVASLSAFPDCEQCWSKMILSLTEITEQKHLEKMVMENYAEHTLLFSNSPIGLWYTDFSELKNYFDQEDLPHVIDQRFLDSKKQEIQELFWNSKILDVNQRAISIFEFNSPAGFQEDFQTLFGKEIWVLVSEMLLSFFQGKMVLDSQLEHHTKSGKPLHALMQIGLPQGFEETWSRVYFSIVDITRRRLMEIERQRQEEHMKHLQKMEAVGQLAGGIAHDFNNVLGAIMGYASMGRVKVPKNSQTREQFDFILEAATRASDLAKRLLIFSTDNRFERSVFDLRECLQAAMALAEAGQRHHEVIWSMPEHPVVIEGDKNQLEQVFLNLFINAFDAMVFGGQVAVHLQNDRKSLTLQITDNGEGIPEENLERIFEPFFTTKEPGKGTGLGLSTVFKILELHQGQVEVQSRPGRGTTFTIELPLTDKEFKPKDKTIEKIFSNQEKKIRVVIVDDERDFLDLVITMLESLGMKAYGFESVQEAIENPVSFPDVVILDWNMPGSPGANACEKLQKYYPHAPVILCSGYLQQPNLILLKQLGVASFLRKPFTLNQLQEILVELLDREFVQSAPVNDGS